jgi:hypothetical protein
VKVTTRRSNAIVRKGETVEVEWTPRIGRLIDAGRLVDLTPQPAPPEASRDELVETAEAQGLEIPKSWTKDRIRDALSAAQEDGGDDD